MIFLLKEIKEQKIKRTKEKKKSLIMSSENITFIEENLPLKI